MTNQIDSTSPFFKGANDAQRSFPSEIPPMRTLNDDLISLKNNPPMFDSSPGTTSVVSETETTQNQSQESSSFSSQKNSPFLNENSAPTPSPSVYSPATEPKEGPLPKDIYFSEKPSEKPSVNIAYKITLVAIVFLIIALIGLGGYYFLVVKKQTQKSPAVAETELPNEEIISTKELPEKETPEVVASSEKKATYLPLDISSLSTEEIKASIVSAVNKMGSADSEVFQEFTIVDLNNNPISFPVFAQAAKINLPVVILDDLSQSFSLFVYKNKEVSRLALAIVAKENNTLPEKMLSQEKTLPEDLTFLFLESKPVLTNNSFKSSAYKDASVRYLNF
nr:hypothetical protein [Candidatus Moranbacteria bacterium]